MPFVLPNGAPATGKAELRVREIRTVPDMVLASMPTHVGAPSASKCCFRGANLTCRCGRETHACAW